MERINQQSTVKQMRSSVLFAGIKENASSRLKSLDPDALRNGRLASGIGLRLYVRKSNLKRERTVDNL